MKEVLNADQIYRKFPDAWVLLENPEVDRYQSVLSGRVVWHSRDRDEVYRKAAELDLKSLATLYTGQIPEDAAVIL